MTFRRLLSLVYFLFSGMIRAADTGTETVSDKIDWPAFMARHDLVWNSLPGKWHEGAFLGNGLLGAMIYADGTNTLQWDVGRTDVIDNGRRLAIGNFALTPADAVSGGSMRLDLWNAEAYGILQTASGAVEWRSFTSADPSVTVIEFKGAPARLLFRHKPAIPAGDEYSKRTVPAELRNPEPTFDTTEEVNWCLQSFKAGGGYAVAWGERVTPAGGCLVFAVNAAPVADRAVADVKAALGAGVDELQRRHRAWWHAYYPRSFLSIPDTRLESFYWIQMYKLASATRADRPAMDLLGPWYRCTPWPRIWWNLNIQLTYWPVYAANRLDLGESLTRMLDAGVSNLTANVPQKWQADSAAIARVSSYDCRGKAAGELGNLTWAMHDYWLQYRYSGDEMMLRDRFYPLLRRSVMYMVHRLVTGADGRLHTPEDSSPEYPGGHAPDTNYDLALLRWGLETLVAVNERCGLNDPGAAGWRETLTRLAPFPVDKKTGYMIGAGVPFTQSHRHFSHLLMVYPLHLVDAQSDTDRPLIEQSLDNWIGLEGALTGFSYVGGSAMSAWLGRKESAVKLLNRLLDRNLKPNTMFDPGGPCLETPLAGAAALHEVVLQSWCMQPFGTHIRVFPAVPDEWKDVTFHRLRAEGAFEVSAVRRGGLTQFVQIKSLAGAPCRVSTGLDGLVIASGARSFVTTTEGGITTVDLGKGETVLLTSGPPPAGLVIAPVVAQPDRTNFYGSSKRPANRLADSPAAQNR